MICKIRKYKINNPKRLLILYVLIYIIISQPCYSAVYDPLGNLIFEGRGEELYSIDATYGLIEGGAEARREKKFRDQLKATYVTFNIGESNGLQHAVSVGGFPTSFSSLTLNKMQSDALGWEIKFPQSRGKVSTFISKLTNTTLGNENRTIESESDWYMAGARAETDLGIWDINVNNYQFALGLPRIGVSYVNKYFTNYDLSRTSNPFAGIVAHNPPAYLYLKFLDGSPENIDGARVFWVKVYVNDILEYNFAGSREPVTVLYNASNSTEDGQSRWVDEDGFFIYQFFIPNSAEVESVRFELDIANDYVVQLSTDDNNYRTMLSARGNVRNGSNRGWRIFYYGESIGESTLGVDLETTLWGIAFEAERAWLIKNKQFPSYKGEKSQETAGAWFIDANRGFGPLLLAGEYTYIDPFFNASDFVDDDDDGDGYLDGTEPFLPDIATENDLDGDNIPDWEDDFLLFRRDPPKFRLGLSSEFMDFNNNGEPDDSENDNKPDYRLDYEEGSKGYRTYMILDIPFVQGLSVTQGYYKKELILDKKSARAVYALIGYTPREIPNFGTVQLRFMTKRAHDIIPDDLVNRKDTLALQNSLSNIVTLIADYKKLEGLTLTTKLKYQYDADFHGNRRVIDTILINQARYDIEIGQDTVLSPAYRNDKTIGYTIPREEDRSIDSVRQAFILQGVHRLSEEFQVSAGVQYLTYRDLKNPLTNYNRRVGFLALALQGKIAGKNVGMLGSLDYITNDLPKDIGGSQKSTTFVVKLFLL
ncbi:hypothetical protein GF312_11745 [Candidatus Poribacteria bacterium]|nr:hypothetical protein [Candidatus Poribacteria bacterium]